MLKWTGTEGRKEAHSWMRDMFDHALQNLMPYEISMKLIRPSHKNEDMQLWNCSGY